MYRRYDRPIPTSVADARSLLRLARQEGHAVALEVLGIAAGKVSAASVDVSIACGRRGRLLRAQADALTNAGPPRIKHSTYPLPEPEVDEDELEACIARHPGGKGLGQGG